MLIISMACCKEVIALLRGVTPVGQNCIPKMSFLREILEQSGFQDVRTYIQSGNIVLKTGLSSGETANAIHACIKEKIGADLSVIIKTKEALFRAAEHCPFGSAYDSARIHLVFTNDPIDEERLAVICQTDFGAEELDAGEECLYLYLPRTAPKKRLNTNYLEGKLGIVATMRKLSVVQHLAQM